MGQHATVQTPSLPNGRLPELARMDPNDTEALQARVRELETLCAEVYVAAVELGLPQVLLNRLWTVAAKGGSPHAFEVEMPPRPAPRPHATSHRRRQSPPPAPMPVASATSMQTPDIRLTDRPFASRREGQPRGRQPELNAINSRRTVLVVDDDPMMLEVLVRILQRENYELITAGSGPEALEKALAHPGAIDLLITDYAMPEMEGRELAERMRTRYGAIRVLYQTGFSDMLFENREELEDGAAFVEKPFTARGLREAARFILFGAINPE